MKKILNYIIVTFSLLFLFVIAGCYCDEVEENKFRVIFKDYDGTILREEIIEQGHKARVPENTDRYGYIFIGWDKEITNIETDTIYTAQYQRDETIPLEYNVVFVDDNGTILKEQVVKEGEDAIAPDAPQKYLMKFIGWDKDYTNVQSDLEVTAQYEKLEYEFEVFKGQTYNSVTFGRYPRTVVTDENIINALSSITEENEYGYLEYNGNEYKKVDKANLYDYEYHIYEFNNGDIITQGETYYFLVEPIIWNIIEEKDGTLTIISDMILDSLPYAKGYYKYVDGYDSYPSNYKYSDIRAWLNGYDGSSYEVENYTGNGFIDIAFTELERSLILTTFLEKNSESEKDNNNNISFNTYDKIYMLHEDEYFDIYNKFSNEPSLNPMQSLCSDYTRTKYCRMSTSGSSYGYGYWWLRGNAEYEEDYAARIVCPNGMYLSHFYVWLDEIGVRPVLRVKLPSYFDVVFKDYDGTVLDEQIVIEGKNAIAPESPTRVGYEFIGWDKDFTNISEDISVGALYNRLENVNIVTFNSNGGSLTEQQAIELDGKATKPLDPTKIGYTFMGWYNGEERWDFFNNKVTEDITLEAKWIGIQYNYVVEEGVGYIEFGRYPQSVVTDQSLINELEQITEENNLGYIEYYGEEYKKVVADTYAADYEFTNNDLIVEGNTYYFLVEPIRWRIYYNGDGTYNLLSEMILDNTNFYTSSNISERYEGETEIYSNNYEYSNIRAWLNGYDGTSYKVADYTGIGFLDIAFNVAEKEIINNTLVDNKIVGETTFDTQYQCDNTTDKIYLLSIYDIVDTNLGFSSESLTVNPLRQAQVTDFARSKKCYTNEYGTGMWWLRTPALYEWYGANYVNAEGNKIVSFITYDYVGVRPALTITLA